MTSNILKVTSHIENKRRSGEIRGRFSLPCLLPTRDGSWYLEDQEGNFWRVINFIRDSISYDRIENVNLAKESGRAFGTLQQLTADLDTQGLTEVLPKFHHLTTRLESFRKIISTNPVNRAGQVKKLIEFVEERAFSMTRLERLGDAGQLPVRVTHNDTKINNVLFDSSQNAIAVVDLDTLMPGYLLFDFGDAIRTGACTSDEDEPDLSKTDIDLKLFQAYAIGYLEATHKIITQVELENLAFSARVMTYIIGLRFLTDYIDGDNYYKIKFPEHNLRRASVQFQLLRQMEEKFIGMERIINDIKSV
jgi:aminoglycoside phosphotransferase (APT) family kinase protein